jgi:hypothetical protein
METKEEPTICHTCTKPPPAVLQKAAITEAQALGSALARSSRATIYEDKDVMEEDHHATIVLGSSSSSDSRSLEGNHMTGRSKDNEVMETDNHFVSSQDDTTDSSSTLSSSSSSGNST